MKLIMRSKLIIIQRSLNLHYITLKIVFYYKIFQKIDQID